MALVLADRVQETTTTTGTGTLTLAGAVSGFQSFLAIGNANTTYYTIVSGTDWEVGIGTYTLIGTTLSRDTVLESSAAGAKIVVVSGATVFCSYAADKAVSIENTQTLTNKTLTSPTLTTPVLGTPSSGTLTNCTGLPNAGLINSSITINGSSVSLGSTASVGTVTSVAALTLGTTGTDLSSTVATNTTTPVITLQVPTASASNRGALSSTDWSTFNGKQAALGYTPVNKAGDTMTGQFTLAAGAAGANAAPIEFQSGTLQTTAEAGAMEYDGTVPYFSIAASTRGAVPTEQIIVLTGTNTLTSQTAVQPIFDGGGGTTNGAVTLPVGTYQYEMSFALTGMSATSGSFGFGLGGTATKTFSYHATTSKAGTSLTTGQATLQTFGSAANTALQTASTGTVGTALIKGIMRVTVTGTVIPQVSLTVASAAVVQANSYFKVSPIGNATVATVGNWS